MANIQERRDRNGKLISYSIRVYRGRGQDGRQLKPWTATFEVLPTWTEKSARKKAEAFAATFERDCREGVLTDSRQRFQDYCEYVIDLKASRGLKISTVERYRDLTKRIYPEIGYIKLKDLRPDHLNDFYTKLSKTPMETGSRATATVDLLKGCSRAKLAKAAGLSASTVGHAVRGEPVAIPTAQAIADALGVKVSDAFQVNSNTEPLSQKTVLEYHRLISSVLAHAVKEGLVTVNAASRATPPSPQKKEPNYFQPDVVEQILEAADAEPLKYQAFLYLCVVTGARRGELAGLKWDHINLETGQILIDQARLYSRTKGSYGDTTKTNEQRPLKIPAEVTALLVQLHKEQAESALKLGDY